MIDCLFVRAEIQHATDKIPDLVRRALPLSPFAVTRCDYKRP